MKLKLLALILLFLWSCSSKNQADLLVINAKVYTVDHDFQMAEAFAIKDGKFIKVGTTKDILAAFEAKEIIDAEGNAVFPGFYDAHAHFPSLAEFLGQADLNGSKSFEEVIERLKAYEQKYPEKTWIIGGGWDQNLWPDKKFPTKDLLDKAFPDKAVFLSRVDYHAAVVNSKTLALNNILEVKPVLGGIIGGEGKVPNGLLIDNAVDLIQLPPLSDEQYVKQLQAAQDSLFAVGLTSIVDAGLPIYSIDQLQKSMKKAS